MAYTRTCMAYWVARLYGRDCREEDGMRLRKRVDEVVRGMNENGDIFKTVVRDFQEALGY